MYELVLSRKGRIIEVLAESSDKKELASQEDFFRKTLKLDGIIEDVYTRKRED